MSPRSASPRSYRSTSPRGGAGKPSLPKALKLALRGASTAHKAWFRALRSRDAGSVSAAAVFASENDAFFLAGRGAEGLARGVKSRVPAVRAAALKGIEMSLVDAPSAGAHEWRAAAPGAARVSRALALVEASRGLGEASAGLGAIAALAFSYEDPNPSYIKIPLKLFIRSSLLFIPLNLLIPFASSFLLINFFVSNKAATPTIF